VPSAIPTSATHSPSKGDSKLWYEVVQKHSVERLVVPLLLVLRGDHMPYGVSEAVRPQVTYSPLTSNLPRCRRSANRSVIVCRLLPSESVLGEIRDKCLRLWSTPVGVPYNAFDGRLAARRPRQFRQYSCFCRCLHDSTARKTVHPLTRATGAGRAGGVAPRRSGRPAAATSRWPIPGRSRRRRGRPRNPSRTGRTGSAAVPPHRIRLH
jgi:hypothetical protein